jgi:antitoxin (DNA-binding transcriptional repressor) of toxin-antitoxin stability system
MRLMPERVSTLEVRQRIGDLLSRVALRRDEFIIERKGKPIAALIRVERPEQMRRFARRHALEILERQAGNPFSDEEAKPSARHASVPGNATHSGSPWRMAYRRI